MNIIKAIYFNSLVNRMNRNLKIKQKAYLAFLLIVIFLIAFGVFQYNLLNRMQKVKEDRNRFDTFSHNLSELIVSMEKGKSILNLDYLSTGEMANLHRENLQGLKEEIRIIQSNLESSFFNPVIRNRRTLSKHIKEYQNRYNQILNRMLSLTNEEHAMDTSLISQKLDVFQPYSEYTDQTIEILMDTKETSNQHVNFLSNRINKLEDRGKASIWIFIFLGILASIIIANFVSLRITRPVEKINRNLDVLANGNYELEESFHILDNDEIGEMVHKINKLGKTMKQTILFTEEIGKNNFDTSIQPESQGKLTSALFSMRDNLKEVTEQNELRRKTEEKRQWVMEKISGLVDVLRQNYERTEDLYFEIIRSLVNEVEATQGGLFILSENEQSESILELKAAYAYNRRKLKRKQVKLGEGLVGQCAIEKEKIVLTEIPADYLEITSGLGQSEPSHIIIIPLLLNEKVYGVFELASFHVLEEHQMEYLERAAGNIASTIYNASMNAKTKQLLETTQRQKEELATKEEQMKQNIEDLKTKKEEAERRAEELQQQYRQY